MISCAKSNQTRYCVNLYSLFLPSTETIQGTKYAVKIIALLYKSVLFWFFLSLHANIGHTLTSDLLVLKLFTFSTGVVTLWKEKICLENALHLHAGLRCRFWSHGSCFFNICTEVSREAGKILCISVFPIICTCLFISFSTYVFKQYGDHVICLYRLNYWYQQSKVMHTNFESAYLNWFKQWYNFWRLGYLDLSE